MCNYLKTLQKKRGKKMIERQIMHRKEHRYWPFYRYAGCWWQHPYYCQLPFLRCMEKPTPEDEEELKDDNNILDKVLNFATRFKRA
jgi:hypothetical protein